MKNYLLPLFLFISLFGFSQENKINMDHLINDTQVGSNDPDVMSIIWWIPIEFWLAVLDNDASITDKQGAEIIEVLKSYSIFAVVDGKIGPFGGITYTAPETIERSIAVTSNNNIKHRPLDFEDLNIDAQNMLLAFKPMIENMLGPMGENMHFFVFSDIDAANNRVFNPKEQGIITMHFNESKYEWKTPLGAVMPPKICPFDKEKLNGTWNYCPWHGEKLRETAN